MTTFSMTTNPICKIYILSEDCKASIFLYFYSDGTAFVSAWNHMAGKWRDFKRSEESAIRIAARYLQAGYRVDEF